MGCTPSKQVSAAKDSHEERVQVGADGVSVLTKDDGDIIAENGTRTEYHGTDANGKLGSQKANSVLSQNTGNEKKSEMSRHKVTQISRSEKKFTQSQLDFFEMLDKKIESGPDYVSEDEKSTVWSR